MKKNEIKVGATYRMKHTSGYIDVRILREVERRRGGYGMYDSPRYMKHWIGLNLKTNREIEIKSAVKLLREVETTNT